MAGNTWETIAKLADRKIGGVKVATLGIVALCLLPALAALAYILLFGVNVVYYDQYEFVPVIDKLNSGQLTFGDLYAQHNEHRLLFPRIVMLATAEITHYNTVAEICVSWGMALLTMALLFLVFREQFGKSPAALLAFVPVAWMIFSLRAIDNWLQGWQLQIYLCILALVFSLYCLHRSRKFDKWLALALLGGVVATFSFLNGLLVWPAGLLFLVLARGRASVKPAAALVAVGALAFIAYFAGWHSVSSTSPLDVVVHAPASVEYLLVNIGAPLGYEKSQALAAGIFVCAAVACALYLAGKNGKLRANAMWLALMFFALASSSACLLGRSALGIDQALSSRYVTFTMLTIVGLYVLAVALLRDPDVAAGDRKPLLWAGFGMLLGIIVLGLLVGYIGGVYFGASTHASFIQMQDSLAHYATASDSDLSKLYPFPEKVRIEAAILQKYGLSVFA